MTLRDGDVERLELCCCRQELPKLFLKSNGVDLSTMVLFALAREMKNYADRNNPR